MTAPLGAVEAPVSPEPAPASPKCRWLLALCLLGVGLFSCLGVWQVQRLLWKLDLIAAVDARIHAEPVAPPTPAAFAAGPPNATEYRRVVLNGQFLNDKETLVQAVTERGGGFWVLTPFVTDAGFPVLVNRGFVPPENRTPDSRRASRIDGPTRIVGLLRLSEPGGGFLRSNDPAQNRWFSRDVHAIAAARGLSGEADYFVDAERSADPAALPVGGLTVVRFANNHLVYALTWFALAAMSLGATVFLWRQPRGARS